MGNIYSYFFQSKIDDSILLSSEGLTKKYRMNSKLAKLCNRDPKEYVIRFEILKYIYDLLRTDFQYTHTYYGELDDLNHIIGFDKNTMESISHHKLQILLIRAFRRPLTPQGLIDLYKNN